MALGNLIQDQNELGDPIGRFNELGASLPPARDDAPALQGGLQPLIQNPARQSEIERLNQKISGYENPNKPQGFWQKLGHIAAGIGNVAGDIAVPNVMARIPHTQMNNDLQYQSNLKERQALQEQDQAEQNDAQKRTLEGAQTGEATARTRLIGDQADAAENPKPDEPSLAQAYAHAVLTHQPPAVIQHIADAIVALQPGQNKEATAPKTETFIPPGGTKPTTFQWNPQTNKFDIPLGEHYERPITVNNNSGDASLDRLAGRLGKPYQTGFDAANSQLEKIDKTARSVDSGYVGQSLAIPELITSLVSGAGTGVRVTQAELSAVLKNRGIQGDVDSFFNRISGQGNLTDTDKKQIKGVLNDVRQKILLKQQIHKEALDSINGASDRSEVSKADAAARQKISDLETKGFFIGQRVPGGTVVGITPEGKIQVDSAH